MHVIRNQIAAAVALGSGEENAGQDERQSANGVDQDILNQDVGIL